MNYPNRMAVRCWNHTCTALIILAALYFAGRICVAFTSGRVQQITQRADKWHCAELPDDASRGECWIEATAAAQEGR
jgi:hypothetical protein